MATNVIIKGFPEPLHYEIKKYAVLNRMTMREVVIEACKDFVSFEEPGEEVGSGVGAPHISRLVEKNLREEGWK